MSEFDQKKKSSYSRLSLEILCPDIPPSNWCDFRIDYESGISLNQLAIKYNCDHRTVRNAIIKNKNSCDIGARTTTQKLSKFIPCINSFLQANPDLVNNQSIYKLSCQITLVLQKLGYSGSERTVRTYLYTLSTTVDHQTTHDASDTGGADNV